MNCHFLRILFLLIIYLKFTASTILIPDRTDNGDTISIGNDNNHQEGVCGQAENLAWAVLHHQLKFPASERRSKCHRKWPSISVFVPINLRRGKADKRFYEFEHIFLRTFLYFWPLAFSNTSLIVGVDDELMDTENARIFQQTLDWARPKIRGGVTIMPIEAPGDDRQQYDMFWGDKFTDSEFVAFCDTDTAFVTSVDREDIFLNGKPIVNAISGYNADYVWGQETYAILGVKESFRCMSYFPVVIKTSHLRDLRDYMSRLHNKSFDRAFQENVQPRRLSQFHILCTYLYLEKRDEYVWYAPSETPDWDGKDPPPPEYQNGTLTQFTPEMLKIIPRIATHTGYRVDNSSDYHRFRDVKANRVYMNALMQQGTCADPRFTGLSGVCESAFVRADGYFYEMYVFGNVDFTKLVPSSFLQAQFSERLLRLKECHVNHWDPEEMRLIMKPEECMIPSGGYA